MEESKFLTQQKFQQILFDAITCVQKNENIRVAEIIEEIKQQIISEKRQI